MSRFLESIHIDQYGAFSDRHIGPFAQGLNVVFGPNEAGKSTIVSFIGGVLFGWEEAHGVRNTYTPESGKRSGTIAFSDGSSVGRIHTGESLQNNAHVTGDLDRETYQTMFSLTSDELRMLRNSSDVTARLLSAGSGTGSSPAKAFVEIEQRIAALTSRSEDAESSVFNLSDKLDNEMQHVKEAAEREEQLKREDRELRALHEDRAITARHLSDVNRELEKLGSCQARIDRIDDQMKRCRRELSSLESEHAEHACETDGSGIDPRLMQLDNAADRSLRDKLDEYADEQAKTLRGVDLAKENAAASSAAYEALVELGAKPSQTKGGRRRKGSFVLLPAVLAIAFALAGVPTLIHARSINSLSLTALGIGLIFFACLLAVVTVVLVARPNRSAEALDARQQDAEWVMLQDKKKLQANLSAKEALDKEVSSFLERSGLSAADGSIRQARALLDDAREARSNEQARKQRIASLEMRISSSKATLEDLALERQDLLAAARFEPNAGIEDIEDEINLKESQRVALAQTCDDMSTRIGELTERLQKARDDRSFNFAKLAYQQTRVQLRDAKRELITLLLAKRMIEKSIAAWESRSQPEVYRRASELLSTITDGAWCQVSMTAEGRLFATSADGTAREVRHLSLGTCQQLYLALRIAMLLHADNVGRAVPVLADDILVNFDTNRRAGAARALAELAEKRQVIVFTCHEETVAALRAVQPALNYLEL